MIRPTAILLALAPVCFIGPAVPQFAGFSGGYEVSSRAHSFGLQIAQERETMTALQKVEQCHLAAGPGVLPAMMCLEATLH